MSFANNVLDRSKPRYYRGRKGIEPAGAKGVYILKTPKSIERVILGLRTILLDKDDKT